MTKILMQERVLMPALSFSDQQGTLAKWLVKEGDVIKVGDVIAEIETDKATMEYESVADGVVVALHIAEGTAGVKVGTPIATMNLDIVAVAEARSKAKARAEAPMKNLRHFGMF